MKLFNVRTTTPNTMLCSQAVFKIMLTTDEAHRTQLLPSEGREEGPNTQTYPRIGTFYK